MSENEYGPREKKPVVVMVNPVKIWSILKRLFKGKERKK